LSGIPAVWLPTCRCWVRVGILMLRENRRRTGKLLDGSRDRCTGKPAGYRSHTTFCAPSIKPSADYLPLCLPCSLRRAVGSQTPAAHTLSPSGIPWILASFKDISTTTRVIAFGGRRAAFRGTCSGWGALPHAEAFTAAHPRRVPAAAGGSNTSGARGGGTRGTTGFVPLLHHVPQTTCRVAICYDSCCWN